jgi:hypothetical protein
MTAQAPDTRGVKSPDRFSSRKHRAAVEVSLGDVRPAAVNDRIYKPVRADDPAVRELAKSIRTHGVLDPIQVTSDGVILSGHRRHAAARLAGLTTVPVTRRDDLHSADPAFVQLLVEANRSRDKTADERVREAVAATDPAQAHAELLRHRHQSRAAGGARAEQEGLAVVAATAATRRHGVSAAKRPMLEALKTIVADNRDFWPLTLRQCHYRMLNVGVLKNTDAPGSRYLNDQASYKNLSDLLTRARLAGEVPWHAVTDPTRPATAWDVHPNATPFVRRELDGLLKGYYRDLLQSQDFYLEVVAEKLTAETPVRRAAEEFTATFSVGRGYSSIDFRYQIAQRFRRSGKPYMRLLVVSDYDPEGEDIAKTLAASLRGEFGVDLEAHKVTLTGDQVREFGLPPNLNVKASSSRAKGFTALHGGHAYELEALEPANLQAIVAAALGSVIDRGRFDAELAAERDDAAVIAGHAAEVRAALGAAGPRRTPD